MQDQILQELPKKEYWISGFSLLAHPPYLSDLKPSDFHLFYTLQNIFSQEDGMERLMEKYFN